MILSNVNIGTGPSTGDGDPLRIAFNTINQNFAKIESNVNVLTNSVSSVAGRTGNVTLTINDIVGINNYATLGYVNSTGVANIASIESNIASLQADINTLYGNAGVQSATLATLTSNAASQAGSLQTLTANAATQAGELSTLVANAAVQAGLLANLQATSYGNANVSAYLPSYTGNVGVGNLVFSDLSVQTTAYTGAQWRSNLTSSLVTKPTWLSYVPGGKNQEGTQYGFDANGMFFAGNSDNDFAYPIQTNIRFHEDETLEVVATVRFNQSNNDQGLAIFNADTRPIWRAGSDSSRIAFQFDAGIPVLYGQTTANTAPGIPVLSPGNWYTVKFVYNPGLVTVSTFAGNVANGSALDVRTINETLPAGDYSIGFDADMDQSGVKSYFTNLIVRTFSDTAVNDLEVVGTATVGNIIPSANVTYSLGNVTHQWKDLWVSNNTIYINSVPLSIDSGGSLLVNGAPISSTSNVAFTDTTMTGAVDSEVVVAAATSERVRAQLRLNPTDGDAFLETWSYENTRSDTTWATGTWDLNIYNNPRIEFTGAFDLANFIVNTLQSLVDPDTVSYSINGGEYIPWDGGSSADPVTGYASIGTSTPPPVNPTAITSIDWKYAFKSQIGLGYGSSRVEIQTANQDLDININGYVQLYSSGSIDINNSQNNNDITLYSGDDILLQGKNKTTSDSEGGDINIYAGNGGAADAGDPGGSGGDIQLYAGAGGDASSTYNAGPGGFTRLRGGQGGAANALRNAGVGGYLEISAGDGGDNIGNVNQGAAGGDIDIVSGDSTLANTAGGHITLSSGVGGFNAPSGYVEINIPLSDAGPGGVWTFTGEGTILNVPQNAEIFNPSVGNLTVGSAGNVFVRTVDPSLTSHTWEFTEYGALRFPSVVNALYQIYETEGGLELDSEGGFYIVSNVAPGQGGGKVWSFQANGDLYIPGDIKFANGVSVLGSVSGNITVGNSAVNFVPNSSGDGNGFSTIEILPDSDLNTDQYIIVDPTGGEPGHIHLRAGGTQDASTADLYLGGELTAVRVSDTSGIVTVRTTSIGDPNITQDWAFESDGTLYFPGIGNHRIGETINGISLSSSDAVVLESNNNGESRQWQFGTDGNITFPNGGGIIFDSSAVSKIDGITSVIFADSTEQTTAWTGTVAYGNTIAIGYQTGNTSQGNNAVAIGSAAGQTSQGAKAIGIGEVAGRLNQGIESIGLGAGAGEQNQGAYAIAIGSTTAYLNQGVGAVAIGTSAGALYQGEHAIAIGTGAGNGLQGNNSIILNATGSTLDQTTDDTFTVKPIRSASAGNILYYDPSSGEITYSTNSGGTGNYSDANVVSLLSNFGANSISTTGNITAQNFVGNISFTGNISGTQANVTLVAGAYSWTFANTGSADFANGTVSVTTLSAAGNVSAGNLSVTGNISGTVSGFNIGYREVPQVSAGNVTLGLTDSGKHYYSTASNPTTITVPSNANVAFPIGTAITIVNSGTGNITVGKQAEANLYLAGNTTNAARTLTSYGMATLLKTATDQWFINGTGLI